MPEKTKRELISLFREINIQREKLEVYSKELDTLDIPELKITFEKENHLFSLQNLFSIRLNGNTVGYMKVNVANNTVTVILEMHGKRHYLPAHNDVPLLVERIYENIEHYLGVGKLTFE